MPRLDRPLLPPRALRYSPTTMTSLAVGILVGLLGLCLSGPTPARAQLAGGELPQLTPIDVPSVEIEGLFLLDGEVFTPTVLDGGTFSLDSATGATTSIGQSWDQSYGPFRMLPGEYTPRYSSFFAPATAPHANVARFTATRWLAEDRVWDLDVPSVVVQLNFLLNGASPPGGGGEEADIFLRDVESGQEILVGSFLEGNAVVRVVPGEYDVYYSYQSGVILPQNEHARILEGVTITEDMELDVDVPSVYRVFSYRLNGDPFPNSFYDNGRFHLEQPETGDRFLVGYSFATSAIRVVPGTYDVIYEANEVVQGLVPSNRNAVVEEALVISSLPSQSLEVDVTAVRVDAVLTQNGSPFVASIYDNGRVSLEMREGDRFEVGETATPPNSLLVVAGVYDAIYENTEPGPETPLNPFARFATGIVIDEHGSLVLDVPAARLDFTALLDGEPFPNAFYDNGDFHVVGAGEGNSIDIGNSWEGPFSAWLVAGEYDIVYRVREAGDLVPANTWRVVAKDVVLPLAEPLELDIRTMLIAPRFSLDGAPFPTDAAQRGALFLRDPTGDEVALGETHLLPPDVRVIEGAYRVEYEWRAGDDVPQNTQERLGLLAVPEPGLTSSLAWGVLAFGLIGGRRPRSI